MPDLLQTARPFLAGGGRIESHGPGGIRLTIPATPAGYADAQLDDTQGLPRARFLWRPPLRLAVRARVDHPAPLGTWGFGFWNDPFAVSIGTGGTARRMLCAPRAVWFFHASPPNAFGFTSGPTCGWRAMAIDSPNIPGGLLTPAALVALALAQLRPLRGPILRYALSRITASEAVLGAGTEEVHDYVIDWEHTSATFSVDGRLVLRAPHPPAAPLGFVAWIDNQFAVARPEAGLRFGVLPTSDPQSLDILSAEITPGAL
ncbi:MAG: hypothetical protein FJZ97_11360 [Chloroflexi bacterium]|nr:hypothetical protein [Chloroflexota bacterium]